MPIHKDGVPAWDIFTMDEIRQIETNADDFAGEYMCEPSAGADVFFDRDALKKQVSRTPIVSLVTSKCFILMTRHIDMVRGTIRLVVLDLIRQPQCL